METNRQKYALAQKALVILIATASSILIQGFQFGLDNNLFSVAYLLNFERDPTFESDLFYQSLNRYVSGVWPVLSLITTAENIDDVFLAMHIVSRIALFAAFVAILLQFGVCSVLGLTLGVMSMAVSPLLLFGPSFVGKGGLLTDNFSQSEFAYPFFLGSILLLGMGRVVLSYMLLGVVININIFEGFWNSIALLSVSLFCPEERAGRYSSTIYGSAVAGFVGMPVLLWTLWATVTLPEATQFDFVDYLRLYYPHHSLIEAATIADVVAFVAISIACGLALRSIGAKAGAWAVGLGALVTLFLFGVFMPYVTHSRLPLNLQLLRTDSIIQIIAVSAVVGAALAPVPGHCLASAVAVLSLLVVGEPVLLAFGTLALAASREKGDKLACLAYAILAAVLATLAIAAGDSGRVWGVGRVAAGMAASVCLIASVARDSPVFLAAAVLAAGYIASAPLPIAAGSVLLICAILDPDQRWFRQTCMVVASILLVAAALVEIEAGVTIVTQCIAIILFLGRTRVVPFAGSASKYVLLVFVVMILSSGTLQLYQQRALSGHSETAKQRGSWVAIAEWAKANTRKEDVFLVPPKLQPSFELTSGRRIWIDWKRGAAVMWLPAYYEIWAQRLLDVYGFQDLADEIDYACNNNIDFVVHQRASVERIRPIEAYGNSYFAVYHRPDVCSKTR